MNLRKILIKTGLHIDIIDIIENLYIKEIKKEMFEEMNILFSFIAKFNFGFNFFSDLV